MAEKIKEK
jgi:hypothetical protein